MPGFEEVFGRPPPDVTLTGSAPTVVAVVHDEALRLPHFLDHHRAVGVTRFLVIDDRSTDGTAALLDAAPDVTRIPARGAFRDLKETWIQTVVDSFLDGRWALVLDADELLVYPGWPERSLPALVAEMERHGEEALFASLVDMYGDGSLSELGYRPGEPFLASCPYFDDEGYMLLSRALMHRGDLTPEFYIVGGTRQRLFFEKRPATARDKALIARFFPLERRPEPGLAGRAGQFLAWRWLRRVWISSRPAMSKIPLWRAKAGDRLSSGQHSIARRLRLADEWGALLHFKYLQDFEARVAEGDVGGQHTSHYRLYHRKIASGELPPLFHDGSRRFEGVSSLIEAGLVRERG
ncbi:glycosyltransferase family 2 protein [Bosea sp. 117]|uniref:glycosyltransferase family 2 protein n=1 Tax=Bosea sp. 117 TaxID=1125973 RepID=UPI00049413A2|nr:glycosyltransferase family 2 protein [Bosea sp. 117]